MKTKLLTCLIVLCLALTANSQAITITSVDTTPVEIDPVTGATITVNYQYTSTNADDFVYVALELHDDWTWEATVAEGNNTPVALGTDLTGSITLTIPASATLNTDLTGNQNYKILAKLYASGWNWLAENTLESVVIQTATAGLEDINANGIVIYPNPVSDKLVLKSNLLNANTIIISDITGKTVKTINNSKLTESIDVSNLENGMYILTTDTKQKFKFLKN